MKKMKRIVTLLLAIIMVLGMSMNVLADEATAHKITIKNENDSISIDGKTYSAYKLFDSTHSGDAYAYTLSKDSQFYDATLIEGTPASGSLAEVLTQYFTFTATPGDTTKVNVEPKAGFDPRAFADDIQEFLEDLSADKTGVASGETCEITLDSGEAGQGYYIVTGEADPTDPKSEETVVSAVILTNEDPEAEIQPKAGIPTLEKKITEVAEGDETISADVLDEDGQAAVAKVGATVSYELDSNVPDLTGYSDYTFIFGDKITSGLTYDKDSFELKIDGTTVEIDPVFKSDDKEFTLTIPFATLSEYAAGKAIVLTYKATVNENALTYNFEKNTASIEFSRSPYDDETNKTPDKETYVLDINLDALKVDGDDNSKKLDGAEFKLYKGDGTGETYYKWDDTNKVVTWVAEADADVFTTNADGNFTQQIRGLDQGTYHLLETKAPTGYNLLTSAVEVVITAETEDGKVTYTATFDGEGATVTNGEVQLGTQSQNQPVATGTIENNSGIELPSTGGIGTTLFYVFGAVLVIGAGVLLVTRRRMNVK